MTEINNKSKAGFSQLLTFAEGTYFERTSRPIYALVFLTGFVLVFLFGSQMARPEAIQQTIEQPTGQVVAFVWVRSLLEFLGFSAQLSWYMSPLVVVVILLMLQITARSKWIINVPDMFVMFFECVALAVPLIVLSLALNRSYGPSGNMAVVAGDFLSHIEPGGVAYKNPAVLIEAVTGIGAGIYEELIFRLILICLMMLIFQDLFNFKRKTAIIISVLISAILFSAHHHLAYVKGQWVVLDQLTLGRFVFRTIAGIYFAVVFAVRGFGITAGTHAIYNVIVAVLRAVIFLN